MPTKRFHVGTVQAALRSVASAFLLLLGLPAPAAEPPNAEYISDSLSGRIVSVTQQWGELGLNTAVKQADRPAMKLRIKDKEYEHGLGHHANGEIVLDLSGQFETFQADLGVQWLGGQNVGSVVFQIFVDDRKVFDSGIVREGDGPRPVSIPVLDGEELRLVAGDAGDGITCDCADWANARLVRNPAAASRPALAGFDIAPFARVVSFDPNVAGGTKSSRVEEIPAADLFPARELEPGPDGTYLVPVRSQIKGLGTPGARGEGRGAEIRSPDPRPSTLQTGCIGLEWAENRRLRQLALEFADGAAPPRVESIRLETWTGESAWQGKWQPCGVAPQNVENRLVWTLTGQGATQKVRWIFGDVREPLALNGLWAFSRSRWKPVEVRIEPTEPGRPRRAGIEVYNGMLVEPPQGLALPLRVGWLEAAPAQGAVQCCPAIQSGPDSPAVSVP